MIRIYIIIALFVLDKKLKKKSFIYLVKEIVRYEN